MRYELNAKAEAMVERIAERTAEILAERYGLTAPPPSPPQQPDTPTLVSPNQLAEILGVTPDLIYRRKDEYGAMRLPSGGGKKPRLVFNLERVLAILAGEHGEAVSADNSFAGSLKSAGSGKFPEPKASVALLPVKGKKAA